MGRQVRQVRSKIRREYTDSETQARARLSPSSGSSLGSSFSDRPFSCKAEDCGWSFRRLAELTQHTREVHDIIRPFHCDKPGCGYRAARRFDLTKHKQGKRHQQTTNNPTSSTSTSSSTDVLKCARAPRKRRKNPPPKKSIFSLPASSTKAERSSSSFSVAPSSSSSSSASRLPSFSPPPSHSHQLRRVRPVRTTESSPPPVCRRSTSPTPTSRSSMIVDTSGTDESVRRNSLWSGFKMSPRKGPRKGSEVEEEGEEEKEDNEQEQEEEVTVVGQEPHRMPLLSFGHGERLKSSARVNPWPLPGRQLQHQRSNCQEPVAVNEVEEDCGRWGWQRAASQPLEEADQWLIEQEQRPQAGSSSGSGSGSGSGTGSGTGCHWSQQQLPEGPSPVVLAQETFTLRGRGRGGAGAEAEVGSINQKFPGRQVSPEREGESETTFLYRVIGAVYGAAEDEEDGSEGTKSGHDEQEKEEEAAGHGRGGYANGYGSGGADEYRTNGGGACHPQENPLPLWRLAAMDLGSHCRGQRRYALFPEEVLEALVRDEGGVLASVLSSILQEGEDEGDGSGWAGWDGGGSARLAVAM